MNSSVPQDSKVGPGAYFALAFAAVFFSGLLGGKEWYGVFDFTTLNGAFGKVVSKASLEDGTLTTASSAFRGTGGSGAMDGFLFALGLIPAVMFALGMINVLEHYGALRAARKLLTPLLRPLLGIPGTTGLALIGSLQSTDVGASLTRNLSDEGQISEKERCLRHVPVFRRGDDHQLFLFRRHPLYAGGRRRHGCRSHLHRRLHRCDVHHENRGGKSAAFAPLFHR